MTDRPAAGDLTHVATVSGWVRLWHHLPEPAGIEVHAAADFVAVTAPGVVGFPLTADEALELADALAEAAATARHMADEMAKCLKVAEASMTQGEHNKAMFAALGLEWM